MDELTLYKNLVLEIKQRIGEAQTRAVLAVNAELLQLYWDIGQMIDQRQRQEGWGAGIVPRLAVDSDGRLWAPARNPQLEWELGRLRRI